MTGFRKLLLLAATAAITVPQMAGAARPWLLPSETMFAGSGNEWLTVDAAISSDLYYFDHPGQDWQPVVTAPDGSTAAIENRAVGKLRQTFDLGIKAKGTYKIAVVNEMLMGNYMLNGERKMLPRGTTAATLATAVPQGATDVQTATATTRIETFVTAGEPDRMVFATTGKGLEMIPVTHPNDLAVGEPATFQFLLNGKPAAGLDVVAVPGGIRYRADLKQMDAKTDATGRVSFTWPEAGMYWVSISSGGRRGPGGEGGPAGPGNGASGAGGPQGQNNPEAPRPIGPPQDRATYAMTVEVQG
ncbi:DUF4198 domain-containing protein [Sphingobium chungbukense]|uniref:ABC transporter permease n=1 Tax=Sphingobium chungbukense TaxID=56193 RepID=A0A0M3AQ25_9SPHN|nr:DUF4198 domain-containing protein [Sphingobium chungbukense]KKW92287.1 ABC transporter permease [Sphingobium chungbukense]